MISSDTLKAGAETVRRGGVILYPTETVYGLGGDPTRRTVVERIRRIKRRSNGKPMLILTDEWDRVRPWIDNVTSLHERLMKESPPLAVTILFEAEAGALEAVRAGSPRIGIRCTGNDICRRLINMAEMPIISTSANTAGAKPPGRFEDVCSEIISTVDWYVDAGRPLRGRPSTVVAVEEGELRVLREGAVSRQELERIR